MGQVHQSQMTPGSRQAAEVNKAIYVWKKIARLPWSASHLPTFSYGLEAENNPPKKNYHKSAMIVKNQHWS